MKPHFEIGDNVRVRQGRPNGHCRTPFYCRGKPGVIERICGDFPNPEALAYGRDGEPRLPLYRVRFQMGDLWDQYNGQADDSLDIEIYEHWLEAE